MLVLKCKIKWKSFVYCFGILFILVFMIKITSYSGNTKQERLISIKNIEYLMNTDLCNETDISLLGIILVISYAGNGKLRLAHRNAISQEKLKQMKLLRIFLIAIIPLNDTKYSEEELIHEQNIFNDLIQGNFIESYHNIAYKMAMGFKWATIKCSKAKYIIKVDDDTIFDIYYVAKFFRNFHSKLGNRKEFIAGSVEYSSKPVRDLMRKYSVSHSEYKYEAYPYYTMGMLYVTNPRTATILLNAAETTKYFWIEDVYFTGILRVKTKIHLYHINSWFTKEYRDIYCCLKVMRELGYKCDYYVGPNDGDIELFGQFLQASKKCYDDKCTRRPKGNELTDICERKNNNNNLTNVKSLLKFVTLAAKFRGTLVL